MRRRNHVFALKKHEGHCSILRSNALFSRERFSFTSYLFHIFSCRAIGCALSEDYSILRSSMQNYIGKCAVYFSKFF